MLFWWVSLPLICCLRGRFPVCKMVFRRLTYSLIYKAVIGPICTLSLVMTSQLEADGFVLGLTCVLIILQLKINNQKCLCLEWGTFFFGYTSNEEFYTLILGCAYWRKFMAEKYFEKFIYFVHRSENILYFMFLVMKI